ncbi:hypothetical protein ACWDU0_11895 [Streptomyces cellulosae]
MGGAGGACPPATAGATAVGGSWLPPDISAVFASGVAGTSSPGSLTCGAYTVCGNGTERSSPASAVVSVPAHGVPSPGAPPPAAGHADPLPPDADAAAPEAAEEPSEPPVPEPCPAPEDADDDAQPASGAPACPGTAPAPESADAAAAAPAPPDVSPRRSGIPSRSAASCSHSGGLSRNDV